MTMNGAVLSILAMYTVAAEEQGVDQKLLAGTIQNDILKEFMIRSSHRSRPCVSSRRLELAFTIADGIEYVHAAVAAGLDETKKNRDEAVAQECLNRLIHSAKLTESTGPGTNEFNLLKLAVAAARARCTVGEISDALETIWGRHVPKVFLSVVTGAYRDTFLGTEAEGEYNDVLAEVELFAERQGRRPRLLVAKMGQDGHDRGAKVIASGFSDLGFDTPEEVARQAVDSDVHCVGVSSQVGRETHAAGHNTLVPALMQALKDQGAEHILVICGGVIPPKDYDFLYEQGVGAIFGPGTRLPTAAHDTIQAIYKKIKQNEQSNNA
ncbi:hypothetical protein B5M09_011711 [Aphanomyces astaci]|uniref:B12-binding domain-containing protein n=1 Tax=Aphanomyces astaci TaxID=112090 RepID=A0A3R7YVT5_APHAT|nr:hypothetical protein B5M09_011711 [Aphanomyces astaci]